MAASLQAALVSLMLASLVCWLAFRVIRRQRAHIAARRMERVALPAEYRPRRERPAFWITGFGAVILGSFVGASVSKLASAVIAFAVAALFISVFLYRDLQHRRRLVAAVRSRAPSIEPRDKETLLQALEMAYSPTQLETLRQLLRSTGDDPPGPPGEPRIT